MVNLMPFQLTSKSHHYSQKMTSINDLTSAVRIFADERDWLQFHTPKNLALALVGEVGELAELLQWRTDTDILGAVKDDDLGRHLREEVADVAIYLLRLADVLSIDVETAVRDKLTVNAAKYPIDKSRGRATKYTDL